MHNVCYNIVQGWLYLSTGLHVCTLREHGKFRQRYFSEKATGYTYKDTGCKILYVLILRIYKSQKGICSYEIIQCTMGVDSVKSTVTVLEEGDFTEEGGDFEWRGCFSVGGYRFLWRRGAF